MTSAYPNDLTAVESLVTLEAADAILALTLHGKSWMARIARARFNATPDADGNSTPLVMTAIRPDDMAALRDASMMLTPMIWRNGATQPTSVPERIKVATSLLAAHLLDRTEQPHDAETISFYRVGETSASFRLPMRDDLPHHVRTLLGPYLDGSATWSSVRP